MTTSKACVGVLVASALALNTGCIAIDASWGGHTVWIEEVTERIPIDTAGLERVEVKTHNGPLAFTPVTQDAHVVVKKKAGGHCLGDAEEAMKSLTVYVQRTGGGTCRIGYKWDGGRRSTWRAVVAFDIHGPADVAFQGETHNGAVRVEGLRGDLAVETHNGGVRAATTGEEMSVVTHNGRIDATFGGRILELETHNGSVTADLTNCGPVDGGITTHNGSVEVFVGAAASLNLECYTHNGKIRCTAPLTSVEATRRSLHGTIGTEPGGTLEVETHNGSVRVVDKAG